MKYAIGGIFFLGVRFGMSSRPGTSKPRTTAESRSKVSHESCDWQKIIFTCFAHMRLGGGLREATCCEAFPGPRGGNKIEVSHERFNWPKKS